MMPRLDCGAKIKMFLVDPFRLVAEKQILEGDLSISSLERLRQTILSQDRTLHYHIVGGADQLSRPTIRLVLEGEVGLSCQRCMEPMLFLVDIDTTVTLFNSEDALLAAEEEDPTIEGLVFAELSDILWLIEEEVILALPYVGTHETCDGVIGQVGSEKSEHQPNPFSILKHLKRNVE